MEKKHTKGENFPQLYDNDDYIEDLDCTFGAACNYLRKSWKKFIICRSKNDEIGMDEAMNTINLIQNSLGIPMTDWEAYDG